MVDERKNRNLGRELEEKKVIRRMCRMKCSVLPEATTAHNL